MFIPSLEVYLGDDCTDGPLPFSGTGKIEYFRIAFVILLFLKSHIYISHGDSKTGHSYKFFFYSRISIHSVCLTNVFDFEHVRGRLIRVRQYCPPRVQ